MAESIVLATLALELPEAIYRGPMADDIGLAEQVPLDLGAVLVDVNGFIAFGGALHVRGICAEPSWHSLREAWMGERAIHRLFPAVEASDVPFAQDALGDQFLLREESVWLLRGETGELEDLRMDLQDFLRAAIARPNDLLPADLVREFKRSGESLEPGQLLNVYPPFCSVESADGVSLRAISASDRLGFLSDFAKQIANCAEGARVKVEIKG